MLLAMLMYMVLTELDIKNIWITAGTPEHGAIAQRIGAGHMVFPEADMGARVAHLITGRMMGFIEFESGFAITKIHGPPGTHCWTWRTVGGIKRANKDSQHALPVTRILPANLLMVSGPTRKITAFAGGESKQH